MGFATDAITPGSDSTLQAYNAAFSKQTGYSDDGYVRSTDGGYAYCAAGASTIYQHSGSPASADYSVFADIRKLAGNNDFACGVIGRAAAAAQTFYILQYSDISATARYRLFKYVAGVPTLLGSEYSHTLTGTPEELELRMVGDQISGYIDGVLRIGPATDTDITSAGKAGIYLQGMRETGVADVAALNNFDGVNAAGGSFTLPSDQGSYSLTGQSANLLLNRKLTADYGTYALTGQDAGLLFNRLVSAVQGSYALTGQDATLTYTQPGVYSLTAESGTYNWTVSDAFADYTMVAGYDTYDLAGQDAALTLTGAPPQDYVMSVDAGYYSLTGRAIALRWSGAPIVPNSGKGLSMSMRIGL